MIYQVLIYIIEKRWLKSYLNMMICCRNIHGCLLRGRLKMRYICSMMLLFQILECIGHQWSRMHKLRVIFKSWSSLCGYSIVLVPKKDGMWRMCIEFQAMNKITINKCYHIPRIDDLLDHLKNTIYFTKLDLRSG